jgi:hypothetical protein
MAASAWAAAHALSLPYFGGNPNGPVDERGMQMSLVLKSKPTNMNVPPFFYCQFKSIVLSNNFTFFVVIKKIRSVSCHFSQV